MGLILLIIGGIGFLISLFWILSENERRGTSTTTTTTRAPDGTPTDTYPHARV